LAVAVGAFESVTSKQTWRSPSTTDAAYFTQLAAWGYSLSEVERIVTGDTEEAESAIGEIAETVVDNDM